MPSLVVRHSDTDERSDIITDTDPDTPLIVMRDQTDRLSLIRALLREDEGLAELINIPEGWIAGFADPDEHGDDGEGIVFARTDDHRAYIETGVPERNWTPEVLKTLCAGFLHAYIESVSS